MSPYQPDYRPDDPSRFNEWENNAWGGYAVAGMEMLGLGGEATGFVPGNSRFTNLHTQMQQRRYSQQHDIAVARGAQMDWRPMIDTIQGVYTATGRTLTTEATEDYQRLYSQLAQNAPAMGPMGFKMLDMVTGGRSQAALAHYTHQAGRFLRDPESGLNRGYSADTSNEITNRLYEKLFSKPNDFSQTTGLGAADTGELFQELVHSGRMEVDPRTKNLTREGAADQIKGQLTSYSKIMATMKEIFTENGMPNATMRELLDAADAMTGGLQTMSTKEAEAKLRTFQSAMTTHGMSMETAKVLLGQTMQMTSAAGLESNFAMPIAEHGLNMRAAMMSSGALSRGVWGLENETQLQMRAQQNRVNFVASEQGNRMGALQRIASQQYGDGNGGIDASKITGDTKADRAMRALAKKEFDNEDLQDLMKSDGEFAQHVAQATGRSADSISMELFTRNRNQEAISRNNLDRASGAMQKKEFDEMVYGKYSGFAQATHRELAGRGITNSDLAERMRKASADSIQSLGVADRTDPKARQAAQSAAMRKALEAAALSSDPAERAAAEKLLSQYGNDIGRHLDTLAGLQSGVSEDILRQAGRLDHNLANTELSLHEGLQLSATEESAANRVQGALRSGVAGMNSGSMMERLFRNIQIAGKQGADKGGMMKIIKATLTGSDLDDKQAKALVGHMTRMEQLAEDIEAQESKGGDTKNLQKALADETKRLDAYINSPENKKLKDALIKSASGDQDAAGGDEKDDGKGGSGKGGVFSGKLEMNGTVVINVNGAKLADAPSATGQASRGGGPKK